MLSYTVAVKSLDGDGGPSTHGVALGKGEVTTGGKPTNRGVTCSFPLTNTGVYSAGGQQHPENAAAYLPRTSTGCRPPWPAAAGRSSCRTPGHRPVRRHHHGRGRGRRSRDAAATGFVKLTATSESDPTKTVTKQCRVDKS